MTVQQDALERKNYKIQRLDGSKVHHESVSTIYQPKQSQTSRQGSGTADAPASNPVTFIILHDIHKHATGPATSPHDSAGFQVLCYVAYYSHVLHAHVLFVCVCIPVGSSKISVFAEAKTSF